MSTGYVVILLSCWPFAAIPVTIFVQPRQPPHPIHSQTTTTVISCCYKNRLSPLDWCIISFPLSLYLPLLFTYHLDYHVSLL